MIYFLACVTRYVIKLIKVETDRFIDSCLIYIFFFSRVMMYDLFSFIDGFIKIFRFVICVRFIVFRRGVLGKFVVCCVVRFLIVERFGRVERYFVFFCASFDS